MSEPQPIMEVCRHHPDRPIHHEFIWDRFCLECGRKAQNIGARDADAHWADTPRATELGEHSVDGRMIQREIDGDYKSHTQVMTDRKIDK